MTSTRRTRTPLDFDKDAVLTQLGAARRTLIEARRVMRPKSGLARAADGVIAEIDEFALVLTGDRTFFHARPHAALSGNKHPGGSENNQEN
ncbi:hypothetical protein JM93_00321 [Roseibium hamelinense]|uniref:Uncharacterized protein n=1 Tax=Roseibium hamelinense TaxID=150831 RepID=A0A562THP4_9HYPH|nr:hypothetical protein [Roseibium hamelinense]MTI46035.1 hypothetical protein [Roseibium hamelinense]TWI92774.1 hypothetical protein JM93_00321 [Roseibium hamelinense]